MNGKEAVKTIATKDIAMSQQSIRFHVSKAKTEEYAAIMMTEKGWGPFPPILIRPRKLKVAFKDEKDEKKEKVFTYETADGNTRLLAATQAGIKEVPAIVREMTDQEFAVEQLKANMSHGQPLTLEERNAWIARLRSELKMKMADIGKAIGLTEATVSRVLSGKIAAGEGRKVKGRKKTKRGEKETFNFIKSLGAVLIWFRRNKDEAIKAVARVKEDDRGAITKALDELSAAFHTS